MCGVDILNEIWFNYLIIFCIVKFLLYICILNFIIILFILEDFIFVSEDV